MLNTMQTFRLLTNVLEAKGYSLTEEWPDADFVDEMKEMGKTKPSSHMLYEFNELTQKNIFWLALRKKGELVGTVSGRLDVIGEGEAQRFIQNSLRRHWCQEPGSDVEVHLPIRAGSLLRGPIVYMADFFFKEGTTGDPVKTFSFSNVANNLAFAKWPEASALYMFTRYSDQIEKVGEFGFTSGSFLNVASWTNPPPYRSHHESLCILTREDFESNAAAMARNPDTITNLPRRMKRRDREKRERRS